MYMYPLNPHRPKGLAALSSFITVQSEISGDFYFVTFQVFMAAYCLHHHRLDDEGSTDF
jgi:hypothetical protein